METLKQVVNQEWIEEYFNRKHINKKIKAFFENEPEIQEVILKGIPLVETYINGQYYESKMKRVAQLKRLDLHKMITDIFIGIAGLLDKPELYTAVSAMIAGRLGFSDRKEAIQTSAELLAILCETDAYDITRQKFTNSLMIENRIGLPEELQKFIFQSMFLPPMVCEPLKLRNNYDSGYLTHRDSLILKAGNHHDGDICLDVLNIMNRVQLKLDMDFLCQEEEICEFTLEKVLDKALEMGKPVTEAKAKLRLQNQVDTFKRYRDLSREVYLLLHRMGNQFYLTHKVDKRGRIYAQGYHINTQGNPYKKAQVELYNEEIVEGVE